MIDDLTERQRALALGLQQAIGRGEIPESFHAIWGTGLSSAQYPILVWGEGDWRKDTFTLGDYNALADEQLVRIFRDKNCPFPKGINGHAPTEDFFNITVTNRLTTLDFAARSPQNRREPLALFVSHSARDVTLATLLVDLIQRATDIPARRIRCTSVPGFRLEAGADTDETLRQEVRDSICFIALVTPDSLHSTYVMFELGARWGANLQYVPLLANGAGIADLPGPSKSINALRASESADVQQLLFEITTKLRVTLSRPDLYDRHLAAFLESARGGSPALSSTANGVPKTTVGIEMLELINQENNPEMKGIVQIATEIQPGVVHFFPKLEYAGSPLGMKSRLFKEAIEDLLKANILHPPEENASTNTLTYELRSS